MYYIKLGKNLCAPPISICSGYLFLLSAQQWFPFLVISPSLTLGNYFFPTVYIRNVSQGPVLLLTKRRMIETRLIWFFFFPWEFWVLRKDEKWGSVLLKSYPENCQFQLLRAMEPFYSFRRKCVVFPVAL